MKILKNTKKILFVLLFSAITLTGFSQDPPPPPGDGNTPGSDNQLGGAAHVGGGVIILLTLALAYGGKRFYQLKKQEKLHT